VRVPLYLAAAFFAAVYVLHQVAELLALYLEPEE
jgi:hypothetical protein